MFVISDERVQKMDVGWLVIDDKIKKDAINTTEQQHIERTQQLRK